MGRFHETDSFTRRMTPSRKRCTNERDNRFLSLSALHDRSATATEARNCLKEVRGLRVSERTIRRRLKEYRLNVRRPAKASKLIRNQRIASHQFGRDHDTGIKIHFTDESRFCFRSVDGRQRIW
ncbi:hypothetical protein BDFB_005182 [Asbolus verrucosus]|uniref:HTH Tnp Tc3 2 domain containing protein n=1 Tax=Asbolus verrucosus TaxID=1661398 RepID=A0A482W5G5_ASBVE|nr:hypothetical protein BDFB_005182 [Asbolus verrucosus]